MIRHLSSLSFLMLVACAAEEAAPVVSEPVAALDLIPADIVAPEVVATAPLPIEVVPAKPAPRVRNAEIVVPEGEPTRFRLEPGETLGDFARWSGHPVEVLAKSSGLDLNGRYAVGAEIRVPPGKITGEEVAARREAARQARLTRYLTGRGGEQGIELVTVRTGDTAAAIARDSGGVPLWVVAAYNPGVTLDHLRPGQTLTVPMLADTVVDNTPEATVETPPNAVNAVEAVVQAGACAAGC